MHDPNEAHLDKWHRAYPVATTHRASPAVLGPVWPLAYLAVAFPARAVADAQALIVFTPQAPHVALLAGADGSPRFTIAVAERPLALGEILPPLQSLGLEVLTEQSFHLTRPDGVDSRLGTPSVVSDVPPDPSGRDDRD